MGHSTSRCPSCLFEISNNLSTRSTTSSPRRPSRHPRWSRCDRSGFDVFLEPKDLDENVADLHFLAISKTRCGTHCPHPYQASSGSIRLPRWSPCDRVGFRPTANSGLMLSSFTFQVQAQLDLLWNPTRTKAYKNDFKLFPEELDEKVATWHLPSLGAGLTVFTQEHADSIGSNVGDIFTGEHYRY